MKLENYLAKFYDVNVLEAEDVKEAEDAKKAVKGLRHIEIYEKGDDCEPIGYFVTFEGMDTYQYRNIYGKVQDGTAYSASSLKAAAKAGVFF